MIYIVAFGVGLKCPRKIHLNTQCPPLSIAVVVYGRPLRFPTGMYIMAKFDLIMRASVEIAEQFSTS